MSSGGSSIASAVWSAGDLRRPRLTFAVQKCRLSWACPAGLCAGCLGPIELVWNWGMVCEAVGHVACYSVLFLTVE